MAGNCCASAIEVTGTKNNKKRMARRPPISTPKSLDFITKTFPSLSNRRATSKIIAFFFAPQSHHDRHSSLSVFFLIRSIYRTRENLARNELAPITRSDDHARIDITMENVPTCQSAVLIAAGHGLPWTAAILEKNGRTS